MSKPKKSTIEVRGTTITVLSAITYATEADLLNVALFGQTARLWRDANPAAQGKAHGGPPQGPPQPWVTPPITSRALVGATETGNLLLQYSAFSLQPSL